VEKEIRKNVIDELTWSGGLHRPSDRSGEGEDGQ
jgi:hypothetical protein